MENFFYDTEFFSDMRELLYHLNMSDDKEVVEALPDDYAIKVELCDLEPIIKATAEDVADWVAEKAYDDNEERFSENNSETEISKIKEAFKQCFDVEKFNSMIPKLWYPNGKEANINKQDLLNALK